MTVGKDTAIIMGIGLLVLFCTLLVLLGVWDVPADADVLEQYEVQGTSAPQGPRRSTVRGTVDLSSQTSELDVLPLNSTRSLPNEALSALQGTIRGADGALVDRAKVTLLEDVSSAGGYSVEGQRIMEVTTDAHGAFRFSGLPVRMRFVLRTEHPDHASAVVPRIDLESGRTLTRNVRLRLGRKLKGQAVGVDGKGIEGVTVSVYDHTRRVEHARQALEASVASGSDGSFDIPHINIGLKRITATCRGLATQTLQKFQVPLDGIVPPLIFRMPMGLTISGRVVDGTGKGLEGVRLTPVPKRRGTVQALPNYYRVSASDETGGFVITGLPPGAYVIVARLAGFGRDGVRVEARAGQEDLLFEMIRNPTIEGRVVDSKTGEPILEFLLTSDASPKFLGARPSQTRMVRDSEGRFQFTAPDSTGSIYLFAKAQGHAWAVSRPIALSPRQDVKNVTIALSVGTEIVGRVMGSGDQPVSEARIELVPVQTDRSASGAAFFGALLRRGARGGGLRTRSDSQGYFRFQHVHLGTFELRVSASGFAKTRRDGDIVVQSEDTVRVESLRMTVGARLRGEVKDGDGKAVEGARIEIRSRARPGGDSRSAVSDSLGRFEFRHLIAGKHELIVFGRSGTTLFPNFSLGGMVSQQVLLEDGADERISLLLKASGGRR